MKTLYILDAAGYIYRSYFAIRNMTNDKGESTNALFGFVRSLLKIFKDFDPELAIAVFDGPNNAQSRKDLYSSYKAHRATMPPDLLHQIEWALEFCKLFGITTLSIPGVEADDTIGSIALWAQEQECEVAICSSDKDLCQMVNDRIFMLDTYKDNYKVNSTCVEEKFGVGPSLIIDFLALTGDSSDNVPGVPGIGPKSAAELLKQFGSLENLLANLDKLGSKKQAIFVEHQDKALLSKKLVTLNTSVEFPKELSFFTVKPIDKDGLKKFYGEMRFNTLIRELEEMTSPISTTLAPPIERNENYHLVDTEEKLTNLIEHLQNAPEISINVEATEEDPMRGELIGIGFSVRENEAFYVPITPEVLTQLKPVLTNPHLGFIGHNIKRDAHLLKNAGTPLSNISFDVLLASYLLNSHSRRHSLEDLILENFNMVRTPLTHLTGKGKQMIPLQNVDKEKLAQYCGETVDYALRLKNLLQPELEKRGLHSLYYSLELPLLTVLSDMEERGIYLDVPTLNRFGQELSQDLEKSSQEIYKLADEEFNLNSPQQISKILFEKLGIPAPKGTSTSAEVLEALKWEYPIAGKIQEYRGLEKLRSTYVEVLPEQVNPKTDRIHCTFNQSVAATGRLSCQDPNLQNIPVKSEIGLKIREAFKPKDPSWSFISADYSQIELRLLAHLSEDELLLNAFQQGEDIHAHTAAAVFKIPRDQVTKEMRSKAKAVNFGIIYGQGPFGLSQAIGITQKEASQFIKNYFEQYPKVKVFLEYCKDQARLTGKAVTLTGRERAIPEILSKNVMIRNAAERLAVNTPFQGSAADLIKMAMLTLEKEIKTRGLQGYMILQIHDELICEVPDTELEIFKNLLKETMEGVLTLKVPLIVDVHVGKNWKEC